MSSKNIDTQYNNYINYDSISPLLTYQMSKKITRKLDLLIKSCIMKISGGNLKKATVFSSSLNQDVYLIEKRISNRLSLKNKEITEFLIEHDFLDYLNSRSNNFTWRLYDNHYDYIEYNKGGFFNKHRDYQWVYYPNTIQMTCLIGLQNCKRGGDTKIWYPKYFKTGQEERFDTFKATCQEGGILIFPSHWFHSGFEVKDKKRLFMMTLLCEYHNIPLNKTICRTNYYRQSYSDSLKGNLFLKSNSFKGFTNTDTDTDSDYIENKEYKYNSDDLEIITSDDRIMKLNKELIENTNLAILFEIYNKSVIKCQYSYSELNIILRYLMDENIPISVLNKEINCKSYMNILKEIGILDPLMIKVGNKTNSKTMRILDKLINRKINIGLWSSFQPWMIKVVDKIKNIIPFVVINRFVNGSHIDSGIDIYNAQFLKYADTFFIKGIQIQYYKKGEENNNSILKNIHGLLLCVSNSNINLLEKEDKKIKERYLNSSYYFDEPELYIKKNIYTYNEETPKKCMYEKRVTREQTKLYNEVIKEIKQNLDLNDELKPSSFNIEDWKMKYYKYTYYAGDGYDSYEDYRDYESDCNGYDEWGGFYKEDTSSKYDREVITVRYGLYFRE